MIKRKKEIIQPKVKVEINKQVKCPVASKEINKTVIAALELFLTENKISTEKTFLFSIAFLSEKEMKKINKRYRGNNVATDILSFSQYSNQKSLIQTLRQQKEEEIFLGEMIICCQYLKKSARALKIAFSQELAYVIAHGTFHLLGLRHGKRMFSWQEKVTFKK